MPEHLPKLVELLLSKTPDVYKASRGTRHLPHLPHTSAAKTPSWYRQCRRGYPDVLSAGGQAQAKNCVRIPINMIMEDIRQRDH